MTGSPVKLGIIIATLVVGIITLATAFDTGTARIPSLGTGPVVVPTSPAAVSQTPKPARRSPAAEQGLQVGIYNGTSQSGLAAQVGNKLEKQGYVINELGNTTDPTATSMVYFVKTNDEAAATQLAQTQFPGAEVQQQPAGLKVDVGGTTTSPDKGVHLIVFVGDDYLS